MDPQPWKMPHSRRVPWSSQYGKDSAPLAAWETGGEHWKTLPGPVFLVVLRCKLSFIQEEGDLDSLSSGDA